ncbi:MAG: hypothetical protein IEMM0008_0891 [bacterium]|nr:MAG: hypothetical protein IEMM0008_0891 [bacterium]
MSIEDLKQMKPTLRWRERMLDGDDLFSEEIIYETNKVLDVFINRLIPLNGKSDRKQIEQIVKELVFQLNDLGGIEGKYNNYIETLEREELCEFIDMAITVTGYELAEGEDITEDWREW